MAKLPWMFTRSGRFFRFPVLCAALLALATACSAPAPLSEQALFKDATTNFEEENYPQAIARYKELLEQHPFSDSAEIASLNIAHAYYLTHQYDQAVAAFNDFERLYPVSPLLPFVGYTTGMCYLDQSLTGDRDKSASESALRQFEKLEQQFPGTIWARLAAFRGKQARENLAGHELYVGDYYRSYHREKAAQGRYRYIIDTYPETEAAEQAKARLAASPPPGKEPADDYESGGGPAPSLEAEMGPDNDGD